MRFGEGTGRQKALFGLIVGVFVMAVGLEMYLGYQFEGRPDPGFEWVPSRTPPDFLLPMRADVAEMGLVFGSRWETVNGVPAADKHGVEGWALLDLEIGAVNVLTIRQPGGARLELKIPVTAKTWGNMWFIQRGNILVGTLYFLTGVLFFLLRPYEATSWALLCGGSFVGAQMFQLFAWWPGEDFYNVVSSGLVGVGTVSLYHGALAFPVPHRWLRRVPRMAGWLYVGALPPAALWVVSFVAPERGRPDLTGTVMVANWGLILLGFCLFVGRQCVWAVGRRDRAIQQRARLLLVGFAAAFLPITSVTILRTAFGLLLAVPPSVVQPLVLAFPLALGYAMVRNDMFDARLAVRRAGAYALAGAAAAGLVWAGGQVSALLSAVLLLPVLYLAPRFHTRLNGLLYPRRAQLPDLRRTIGDELLACTTRADVLHVLAGAPPRVCDTDSGAAFLLPGATDEREHISGSGDSDVSALHNLGEEPLVQMLVAGRETIKRESLRVDPRFAKISQESRACMDRLNASVLLPIERDGKVIGGLAVGPHESGDVFDPAELELLRELSHQAVQALDVAQLRERSSDPAGGPATQRIPAGGTEEIRLPSVAGGRYVAERSLGEGGFKRVYLARDTRLQREVALAMIRPERLSDAGRKRIEREAQAMARFGTHAHIVAVYDIGEDAGQLYIVNEYMPGGSLEDRLDGGTLPVPDALRIASELCDALVAAHKADIVHRDVKPANVWFSATHSAKLGDFGLALAREESRITEEGAVVGTVAYMAPEQARGETPVPQSDLYALGVVLYEMLAGRLPFTGPPAAILDQHRNATPNPPTTHNGNVPPDLDALILHLLAKAPADRPATAAAVRERLRAIGSETSGATEELPVPAFAAVSAPADIFVGREAELARAEGLLAEAVRGRGKVLLLVGEPGIGKTRLATECLRAAETQGMRVLWGRCYEGEGAPAFWPWVQILRAYVRDADAEQLRAELGDGAAHVAQVVSDIRTRLPDTPEPPTLEGEAARFLLFDSTTRFLKRAAAAQPLMLVLDDLHWADKSSLLLLQFLACELADAPLFVVGTYRDVEVDKDHPLAEVLGQLAREPVSERVHLGGLSESAVTELVEGDDPALAHAVYAQTEGNPFFIQETLRHLADTGGNIAHMGVPEGVRDVIRLRLSRLPDACVALLTVGAVGGRDFDRPMLGAAGAMPEAEVLDTAAVAAQAGLIEESTGRPGHYRFVHALIRETLYDDLVPSRRAQLHRAVGEALETRHAPDLTPHLAALAHHFTEALPAGGDPAKAIAYGIRAAERANAQSAYDDAAAHYERALRVQEMQEPPDNVQRCDLLVALGCAHTDAGDPARGGEAFVRATVLARTLPAAEQFANAVLGLQRARIVFDPTGELRGLMEEALALLPKGDSALRASLLARLAFFLQHVPDTGERRMALCAQALAMAQRVNDPEALFHAHSARWFLEALPPEERLPDAAAILKLGEDTGTPEWSVDGYQYCTWVHLQRGDLATAKSYLTRWQERAAACRLPRAVFNSTFTQGGCALLAGRFEEAERVAAQLLNVGRRIAAVPAADAYGILRFARRWVQGQLGEEPEQVWAEAAMRYPGVPVYRSALALLHSELGRPEQARQELNALAVHDFADLPDDFVLSTLLVLLSEVAAALGDTRRAALLYDLLRPRADRWLGLGGNVVYVGSAAHWLGLLATTLEQWTDAEAHFEAAVGSNGRNGARPFLARTQFEYARMLLARGAEADREKARGLLTEAAATAEELGMPPLLRDARAALA